MAQAAETSNTLPTRRKFDKTEAEVFVTDALTIASLLFDLDVTPENNEKINFLIETMYYRCCEASLRFHGKKEIALRGMEEWQREAVLRRMPAEVLTEAA